MGETRVSGATSEARSLGAGLLVFAPLCLAANEVTLLLRYPEIGAALVYPPYALLTAALVVAPLRQWPWYIATAAVAHVIPNWGQWPLSWVLLADVANVTRALVAVLLLRTFFGGAPRFEGIGAMLLFVLSVAVVAPAAAATIGAANVALHEGAGLYGRAWNAWFMSNALTGLTMAPLCVIAVTRPWWRSLDLRRAVEAICLTLAFVAVCAVALLWNGEGIWRSVLPLYAPLPVLLWAALRFGPGGASLGLTAVVVVVIWAVDRGVTSSLATLRDANALALQLFVLLTALPVLSVAAIATARHNAVQLYRTLLASLQDHVAIIDASGVVLEVNEAWLTAAEPGAPEFHRVRPGDDYLKVCRSAAARGDAAASRALAGVESVLRLTCRRFEMDYVEEHDGRSEWFASSIDALERSEGGAVVKRTNVTARRQTQMALDEQSRQLSHLSRVAVLSQFTGALAHDLNQPLGAILVNAETARRVLQATPLDPRELAAILDDIVDDDRRAVQVIHRLRALFKGGDVRLQSVDARALLNEVVELARTEIAARHILLRTVAEPDVAPVLGDRVQLQQVLLNLILNACEAMIATPAEQRTLLLSVRREGSGDILLSVTDSGPGIPSELLGRLFEPFVTTRADGLGLGLSISRTIIDAHGGRLWAENNAGAGATFKVLLASADAPMEAESAGLLKNDGVVGLPKETAKTMRAGRSG